MFSPYYSWSRRRGAGDPHAHCSLNVALYGKPKRWAMTERGRTSLHRDATTLSIGPSALTWDGTSLAIRIEETTAPIPSRLRGIVRVFPGAVTQRSFSLDTAGRHRWSPIAPASRVEVEMTSPSLRWSGPGYLDSNEGDRALEADFLEWDWCRAPTPAGATILYNAKRLQDGEQSLALQIGRDGSVRSFEPPPTAPLPPTMWRLPRSTRCDAGAVPSVQRTLEDSPFYARSVIRTRLGGEDVEAVYESLSLRRFRSPIVQAMLPFRIPRWG